MSPVFALSLRSIANRRLSVALTVVAVALAVALLLGVERLRNDARAGFAQTLSGTDLVVGARSGPVQLLLYSVFHLGNATNNMSWASIEHVAGLPQVKWLVPIALGDSHRGHRVVGTTAAFFTHYRHGESRALVFAAGRPFAEAPARPEDIFEVVIGAEVAARLRRERDSAEARGEEAARARLAVESERLRNTLLASLSHDLRTPLTALAGLAESLPLAGPPLPPAQAELAEAIRAEALRTHALARDLLDLARLQADAPHLALDWIAVDELVGSAVRSRAHTLRAHALTLELPDELPLLHADAVLMERVLCNLLDNAAAHTPPGGRITVAARCAADGATPDGAPAWLQIDVCDDGCGLPSGREQAIFERFVRGADPGPAGAVAAPAAPGRARTTGDEGTGLGLALVRAIVEAHGGNVAAHNRACGGACFTLQMPLPPQPEPPPPEAPALTADYQA